jgi:small-conductance mechanosensitive channel
MRLNALTMTMLAAATLPLYGAEAPEALAVAPETRAVMSSDEVVQILDATVDWYRTLGIQQQAATHPSDLLFVYANRQTADKVVALAFEIARANAELLASEAGVAKAKQEAQSAQSLSRVQQDLNEQRKSIQAEIDSLKREVAAATGPKRAEMQERSAVLQGELDLVNARRNLLTNREQFEHQSDADGFKANALKAHIDAIAASIPSSVPAATASSNTAEPDDAPTSLAATFGRFGIWDLASTVLRLSSKANTIETVDQRTMQLDQVFDQIRIKPEQRLKDLAERGETLAAQADRADTRSLRQVRDQYDTLAWLFSQTSAIATPLSRVDVLLTQYSSNLEHWRESTQRQYKEALRALAMRAALFAALLAVVFIAAELWRRAVFRYVPEPRRRSRLLLLRKIVLWALVVVIVASTFATELGSLATFAGLITAGLAVAMQSVLVSVVGYFFLIGKYGIRVGDRVQIGSVTGEVIEMGLVRLHLMELSGQGQLSPTGRVVAFANSIIFQASSGLFKHIPGVDLVWHEITLGLPTGADFAALKDELQAAVNNILEDYRDDMVRQTQAIQKAASQHETHEPQPQVQLRFSAASVDAIVRYPVQLSHAAAIDERVSRELLSVVARYETGAAAHT